ncbi:hypothetical protein AB3N59_04755 [Leptospira sp. WS92.C1]
MSIKLVYLVIFLTSVIELFGESLYLNSPEPKNRFAFAFQKQQQETLSSKKETTNAFAQLEKTIGNSVSLYAILPYTRVQQSGEGLKEHLNNQQIGLKVFLPIVGDLIFVSGFSYFFATGKENLGIGSEKFGKVEFYGGLFVRKGSWGIFSVARWSSQVTPHLWERAGEQFEKTWYFDVWISYTNTKKSFEAILEMSRVIRYDPEKENLYSTVVAPGFLIHLESISLGLSVPITVTASRTYLPDGTLADLKPTFVREDFDRSFLAKAFQYF